VDLFGPPNINVCCLFLAGVPSHLPLLSIQLCIAMLMLLLGFASAVEVQLNTQDSQLQEVSQSPAVRKLLQLGNRPNMVEQANEGDSDSYDATKAHSEQTGEYYF
jgi:hypothetical protein